jgi:glycosyltransferase involved in cell wall biosynthesis
MTSNEEDGKIYPRQEESLDGIQVYRFPLFMPSVFRELWFIPKVVKILRELGVDIVHAHGYRCLSSFQAVYVSHSREVPSVLTPHGIYPSRSFVNGLAKSFFDKSLGRLLLDFSDRIVALSEHNRRLISNLGASEDKIVIAPNGVDVEEYTSLRRSKRTLEELHSGGPILLYVGRIDWNKRVDKIVEALPAILKDFPSAKLVVVGPDYSNCVNELRDVSRKLKVEDSLVITGNVPREKLLEFYSVANVFVLPSSYEGFGLSMLEAMCCKIPVIASPSGGPGDILNDRTHALLLKESSPDEISRLVRAVLTDYSLREELVKNAFELVETKYTWKIVVDQLEKVYGRTIEEKRVNV